MIEEVHGRKAELVEEANTEPLENGGCHLRKNNFTVSTDTPEYKPTEAGKCDIGHDRRLQELFFDITIRNRGKEAYFEYLQLRQV
jgi:hypothetical protein